MDNEQTAVFLATSKAVAIKNDDANRISLYAILQELFKKVDLNEYVMPADEGDLIEHLMINRKFGPVVNDLSKYKLRRLSCVN
tara:strand:+ start:89 stop:337 length:249 start_codon:yes stop_codon:yes gene_type:complete